MLLLGYWIFDPAYGRRVCQLLHERGDVDPDQGVPISRRGDEEDCAEGCEAVLQHGRCGGAVHQGRHPAPLLQAFLEPQDGARQEELQAARRHHGRDCQQGRRIRNY